MTTTSTSAPCAHAPDNFTDVRDLGCKIDALMRTIRYLHRAMEDASDDVETPDECSRDAMDRVLVFGSLIKEASNKATAMAEQVEAYGFRAAKEG